MRETEIKYNDESRKGGKDNCTCLNIVIPFPPTCFLKKEMYGKDSLKN